MFATQLQTFFGYSDKTNCYRNILLIYLLVLMVMLKGKMTVYSASQIHSQCITLFFTYFSVLVWDYLNCNHKDYSFKNKKASEHIYCSQW